MATIDKAAVIEAAAGVLAGWSIAVVHYDNTKVMRGEACAMAEAALPVIAAALLAPLRQQVAKWNSDASVLNRSGDISAAICTKIDADELAALLDQIESDAKGDER